MADADIIQGGEHLPQGSGELLEIHWVTLAEARQLELPHITRIVLAEVERRLADGHGVHEPGPFIYFRHGKPVQDNH
jgi:8-oxo-dGTP pyrophosphatase MutT (NUDIX family)